MWDAAALGWPQSSGGWDTTDDCCYDPDADFLDMFERYGFAGVGIQLSGVMALHSTGSSTGLVVESGESSTTLVPISDG